MKDEFYISQNHFTDVLNSRVAELGRPLRAAAFGAKTLQAEASDLAVPSAVVLRDHTAIRPVGEAALKTLQHGAGRLQVQELTCREAPRK